MYTPKIHGRLYFILVRVSQIALIGDDRLAADDKRMDIQSTVPLELTPNLTAGAEVISTGRQTWRLQVPPAAKGYRLAQLDDTRGRRRKDFRWQPPLRLQLRARASAENIPGTWGFGFWNDPFSMGFLAADRSLRLPALPNAAWFFFASSPNYLSLRDDLPAQGKLAATFRSPLWSSLGLGLGIPFLPLLALPPGARLLRRLARRFVQQDAASLALDPVDWHTFRLEWQAEMVRFLVDGNQALSTPVAPLGRLGLVIWIDNQYLAFPQDGRLRYGVHPCPDAAWIEIADLTISSQL
jgi:hypothetical protein